MDQLRVVVTGGGSGIGEAIARRCAAEGASVVVNDIDEESVHRVAREIRGIGVVGDAASVVGIEALLSHAWGTLGEIDVFFANAGVELGGGLYADDETWARTLEVNLMSHIRAARLLIPRWLAVGGGRFVVTASAAGLLTMPGSAPYAVSKHAAIAFAEWLAVTYGHKGITVQAVCPQGVRTRMLDQSEGLRDVLSHDAVLEPADVAEAVWQGLKTDQFLILPHPEVAGYYSARAQDTDRWLGGMQRIQRRLDEQNS